MNEIEKLFKKISKKERKLLYSLIHNLVCKKNNLNIKKLKNSDFYRLRKGDFRIIFHYSSNNEAVIDSIKLRKENTYKEF